jgi:hypothetical protein
MKKEWDQKDGLNIYKKIAEPFTRKLLDDLHIKDYRIVCRRRMDRTYARATWNPNRTKRYIIEFDSHSLAMVYWLTYNKYAPMHQHEIAAIGNLFSYTSLTREESVKFLALHEMAHILIFKWEEQKNSVASGYNNDTDGHADLWQGTFRNLLEKYIVKEREEEKIRKELKKQYGRRLREFCGNYMQRLWADFFTKSRGWVRNV